jgi:hypothetical protein
VLTLAAAGRERDLATLTGLLVVTDIWWPYSELAEIWPPNRVRGWRCWNDAGTEKLLLTHHEGNQPQAGDKARLWYSAAHTIEDLDSAAATTLPPEHETGLVRGAAGYAAASHDLNQAGAIHLDPDENKTLRAWSELRLAEFRAWLRQVRVSARPAGPPFASGWALDEYDPGHRR